MDANWRPVQGSNPLAGGGGVDLNAAGGGWRAQLQPDARSRIVDKMLETLKRHHLPASCPEELNELRRIAAQFEEEIYIVASNQSDYLRKISLKMLSMGAEIQQDPGNAQVILNQNNPGQDSTAQTGHAGAGDWQEETYQMIRSLKDQHFAELNELFNKISVKLQHVDSIIPRQMPSEQYERMKIFKKMLDRILQVLLISKSTIQPVLRDKVPHLEKQIISILNSQRRKPVQPQVQQQFQPPVGQAPNSNTSQQQKPSESLQQHDSHTNPQASLSRMSTRSQSFTAAVAVIQHANASVDNTAQTGYTGVGDWQEETYQMINSLKDQHFAELNELFNKISVKLQRVDSIIPPQTPSEQYERMKCFKIMLDHTLQILQISKNNIQPALRDKVPHYEKQIISILSSQRRKPVQPQVQQQFQPPVGQAPISDISQQLLPPRSSQQHDRHTNPQASLSSMSTALQSTSAAGIQHVPVPPTTNFSVPAHRNDANIHTEAAQGRHFNPLQYSLMGGALRQESTGPMHSTMNAQLQTGSSSMLSHLSAQRKQMTKRRWHDTI